MAVRIKHLKYTLSALLILILLSSCVEELDYRVIGKNGHPANALILSPAVLDNTLATKSEGVDALGENDIKSLDVYVYKKGTTTNAFFKRYHFIKPDDATTTVTDSQAELGIQIANNLGAALVDNNDSPTPNAPDLLLESNWQNEGYKAKENNQIVKYRIYAIANSELSEEDRCQDFEESDLQGLCSTSNVTDGIYDIFRLNNEVGPTDNSDIHIKDKSFLMYGMVDNWHIDETASQQYFTDQSNKSFLLERAAAKFSLKLMFGNDFVKSLTKVTEWYDDAHTKIKTQEVTTIGNPQFKFTNFMPSTYNATPLEGTPASFRDEHLWTSLYRYDFPSKSPKPNSGDDSFPGVLDYFLTTYSYAFNWTTEETAEKAPSIMVRVDYTTQPQTLSESGAISSTGNASIKTVYYRIPLVDVSAIKEIKRNYHYSMEATINSMGSSMIEITPTEDVKLIYKVVPWPDNPDEKTQVDAEEMYYFVSDTRATLRGNGIEQAKLEYYTTKAPIGTYKPSITDIKVYYMKDPDTKQMLTGNEGINATGDDQPRYTIEVKPTAEGAGEIIVNSNYLTNRAVKIIEFKASVTFTIGNTTKTVTHDYYIKHFPLDNIQSVTGSWSSKWNGLYEGGTPTGESYTGFSAPEGWSSFTITQGDYAEIEYSQYLSISGDKRDNSQEFPLSSADKRNIFDSQDDETIYNSGFTSLEKAQPYDDGYYYWVTRNWNGGWIFGYYTYTYHRANKFEARTNVYTRTVGGKASTGQWVDWENDPKNGAAATTTAKITYDGSNYVAKVFNNSIYPIVVNRPNNNNRYYYTQGNSQTYNNNLRVNTPTSTYTQIGYNGSDLKNNHMYIIQISKADATVTLGRPKLDRYYESKDNVVSPAFMIASQLGAVTTFGTDVNAPERAAAHCHSYMEVSQSGYRFVGWRLPTKKEVEYISNYQRNKDEISGHGVFEDVLTGHWYYTLDGEYAESGYTDDNYISVRCIRDLTLKEIEELNRTGNITSASQ